jgi:alpha-D-ribose 1-methylphosphonate 5-triphosphate diphosphatase
MTSPLPPDAAGSRPCAFLAESLCLANAQLVLPDRVQPGHLVIEAGLIAEIGHGPAPAGAIDCRGDLILPGLVELHTDNLERHLSPRPGVDWPHLPALLAHDAELAACGITTVFDALRLGAAVTDGPGGHVPYARPLASEILEARAAGLLKISHFLHLRAEVSAESLLAELASFTPCDRVGLVSLMDHTPGQRQFRDLTALRGYLTKKRSLTDAEFEAHVARLQARQAQLGPQQGKAAAAEARRLGAVLASHDDTTAAQVADSVAAGVGFAEFPTTAEAARACRAAGIAVMMGAPNLIRGGSHSGNVAAETLARAGLLDLLSSDYVPAALLLSAFRLAALWDDLPRAVACVTEAPARVAGLHDRGRLAPGLRGDVLRVRRSGTVPILRGTWSRGRQVA